ncbi:type II toxin-antitoxin system ParD family antitoxin [uncultured Tateyamaria sp.]|uniref:type II toxin-antitoxin system ParD family antitoxin n=1 Tax=uncultured Tateyamaria sp. TaxID=455651 RepID=UPI00261C6682|nr:type II toxin-antitoxin system ParD family antitoxin [uncultured Tateyamaria sp.]
MSVKASISITDRQDEFARQLVADGQYSSISAVVQRGLELVRSEEEREAAELAALQAFFTERANGRFVAADEGRRRTEDMIAAKARAQGI